MNNWWTQSPRVERSQHSLEAIELAHGIRLVGGVGGGEMSNDALKDESWQRAHLLTETDDAFDILSAQTQASHAGIHLDMDRYHPVQIGGCLRECASQVRRKECRPQIH